VASMFLEKKIGVVIPAHNEEKLIGKVIATMPDFVDHIIVVDDESQCVKWVLQSFRIIYLGVTQLKT
jgi:hypothetical protein